MRLKPEHLKHIKVEPSDEHEGYWVVSHAITNRFMMLLEPKTLDVKMTVRRAGIVDLPLSELAEEIGKIEGDF